MLPVLSQRTGAGGGLAERPGSAGRRRWTKNMLAAKEPVPRRRDGLRLMAQAGLGFGPEGAGPDGFGGDYLYLERVAGIMERYFVRKLVRLWI